MDFVQLAIIWAFQAIVLGIAAEFWKKRRMGTWLIIGAVLPGVGFLWLMTLPMVRKKLPKTSPDQPTDYQTL